jgi:hypothetical protein
MACPEEVPSVHLEISPFCKITREITRYRGPSRTRIVTCSIHGDVIPVPYYATYANGSVAKSPTWTCMSCFRNWVGSPVIPANKRELCAFCKSDSHVVLCELCGSPTCDNHRVGETCIGCYEDCQSNGL